MKNKKSIMTFSALQILIFHLWVYILKNNQIEVFLRQTSYIGVDIFFLISGYSLSSRNYNNYKKFLLDRFNRVYLKYIIFAVIYTSLNISKLIDMLTYKELFNKGGGAYLWFLQAIMLFYIAFPLFQKLEKEYKIITPLVTTVLWIGIAFLITNNFTQLAIIWNRVPIFIIGFYMNKISNNKYFLKFKPIIGLLLLIIGTVIVYNFAFKIKLQTPFRDSFYLMVIPVSIGLTLLIDYIPETRITKLIGSSTLEMYAIQMTFGYKIANKLIKVINNRLVYNILIISIIVFISIITNYLYEYLFTKRSDKKCQVH